MALSSNSQLYFSGYHLQIYQETLGGDLVPSVKVPLDNRSCRPTPPVTTAAPSSSETTGTGGTDEPGVSLCVCACTSLRCVCLYICEMWCVLCVHVPHCVVCASMYVRCDVCCVCMCLHVCVCMCLHVCWRVCMCLHVCWRVCACVSMCVCMCVHVSPCVLTCVCMCLHVCWRVCACVSLHRVCASVRCVMCSDMYHYVTHPPYGATHTHCHYIISPVTIHKVIYSHENYCTFS